MLTDQVVFQNGHISADVTVSAATGPMEFRRARLRIAADQHLHDDDINHYMLRLWAYPDMASTCAGTITNDGQTVTLDRDHPLTFEQYLLLPDPLVVRLEEAIYRLNPNWLLVPAERQVEEKKEAAPNSGSD